MALTDRRPAEVPTEPPNDVVPKGFRPIPRRRARVAAGVALAAIAVGGNVLVYTSLDDTTEVVQVVDDIRAGELVTADDLRVVDVDLDPTVPVVPAEQIGLVADQYARTYIPSGTLLVPQLVQREPLVGAGFAVVAIEVRPTEVPANLRERSRVRLVVPGDGDRRTFSADGRVVARGSETDTVTGVFPLSVEVPEDAAASLVVAEHVGVILLDPGEGDPATDRGGG